VVDLTSQSTEIRLSTARLLEVAFVLVELSAVKFCKVDDAPARNPPVSVESPETESDPRVPIEVREESEVTPGIT
jgi:hypothetical protein